MDADQQLAAMRAWVDQAFVQPNATATIDTDVALATVIAIDGGVTDPLQLPREFIDKVTFQQVMLMLSIVAAAKNPPPIVNPISVSSGT